MKKPPACPECGQLLDVVGVVRQGNVYRWNEEEGFYELDNAQESGIYTCSECGKLIGGWRADGEKWGLVPDVDD